MTASDEVLVQTLVTAGVLNAAHVKRMQGEQQKWGGKLHHYASELGLAREEVVTSTLARALNVPQVRLAELSVDEATLRLVPAQDCERFTVFPCALRDDGKTLWLAMSDPLDVATIEFLRARARVARVIPGVAGKAEIVAAIHRSYMVLGRAVSLGGPGGAPVDEEFKIVDIAGRTQVRHINDIVPPQAPPPVVVPAPMPAMASVTPARARQPLATILLDAGVTDGATLGRASSIAIAGDVPVVFALARWRLAEPSRIAAALSRALACPITTIDSLAQAPALPVPRAACLRMRVLPLWRSGNVVGVAMTDPTDDASVEALAAAHHVTVERLLVDDDALERAFAALAARGEPTSPPPHVPSQTATPAAIAPSMATPLAQLGAGSFGPTALPLLQSANLTPSPATIVPPPPTNFTGASEPQHTAPVGAVAGGRTVLSIVEGVLTSSISDGERSGGDVFRDALSEVTGPTGPVPFDLAGATLEATDGGHAGAGDDEPEQAGDRTVSEDVLTQMRVLVVANRAAATTLRAGLQPRLRELVIVSRFSEAITRAEQQSFHKVVVVDPPERVVRSKQFAALASTARRGLLVVGATALADQRSDVRYVALANEDELVDCLAVELRAALER